MSSSATTLQIAWVYTDDLARSDRFYAEVLGLRRLRDEGTARIYETNSGAAIGVCEAFEDRVVEPRGHLVSLVTDDVDSVKPAYNEVAPFGNPTRERGTRCFERGCGHELVLARIIHVDESSSRNLFGGSSQTLPTTIHAAGGQHSDKGSTSHWKVGAAL